MNSPTDSYFATDFNKQILSNVMSKVRGGLDAIRDSSNDKHKFLLEFIGVTLFHIQSNPGSFDERCIMNIASIGDRFIDEVRKFDLGEESAEHLFAYCYRFLVEYQISTPHSISSELLEVLSRVSDFEYGVSTRETLKKTSKSAEIRLPHELNG